MVTSVFIGFLTRIVIHTHSVAEMYVHTEDKYISLVTVQNQYWYCARNYFLRRASA